MHPPIRSSRCLQRHLWYTASPEVYRRRKQRTHQSSSLRCGVAIFPMSRAELLRIENRRLKFHVGLNVRVVLAEHQLVFRMHFHASRHPRSRQRPVISEPNVVELFFGSASRTVRFRARTTACPSPPKTVSISDHPYPAPTTYAGCPSQSILAKLSTDRNLRPSTTLMVVSGSCAMERQIPAPAAY